MTAALSVLSAAPAFAGNWMQAVCLNPGGSVASNQGWTPEQTSDSDLDASSSFFVSGPGPSDRGCMFVEVTSGEGGDSIWFQYAPPAGSTIAGGSLNVLPYYVVDDSPASADNYLVAAGWSPEGSYWNPFWEGSPTELTTASDTTTATIPAEPSGNVIDFGITIGGQGQVTCDGSCTAQINDGGILLGNDNSPAGSHFGGSLLASGSVHGTADLTFTATDPAGPGVYQVVVKIDGNPVYEATPNTDGGSCVSHGTDATSGAWIFDGQQPCPQTVALDVPVNTTTLSDGQHQLQVVVEDAAQNSSTVLDQTITTDNYTTVASTNPEGLSSLSSASSLGAGDALKLDRATEALAGATMTRRYDRSRVTLSGTVLDSAGAPAPGVTVTVQSGAPSGTGMRTVARAVSDGAGHFVLTVPRGDSRELELSADGGASVVFKQLVTPNVALRVRSLTGARLLFSGTVAADLAGSPRPLVEIEDHTPAGWIPVATETVDRAGRFRYVYQASRLTIGYRFAFRAVTPALRGFWQGASSPDRDATVQG